MLNPDLWTKIDFFHPDKTGITLPFSKRLSIENGWSRRYALRAIEEYKKFIYLAMVSSTQVTPSEQVDQVWHLHLVYTKSYWKDFCGVLGREIHHSPTEGGTNENNRFWEQYNDTMALYTTEFGAPPPKDIWPPAKERFKAGLWRWVSRKDYWLIRKLY